MPPRSAPTHFLCIPLVTTTARRQLTASLASFSEDVTSPNSFAVPPDAVRPVGTIHLTLGVMSFPKNEGLDKAVALLKTLVPQQILANIKPTFPNPGSSQPRSGSIGEVTSNPTLSSLSVTLRGLHSMQSPSKATVLYAPPADEQRILQTFCEQLQTTFKEAGFIREERPLLLHATIVNTIYVKGGRSQGKGGGFKKKREQLTIDARPIIDRYDDFTWMEEVPMEKIAICRMGAKELDDGDQAYEIEAEIDMAGPGQAEQLDTNLSELSMRSN